MLGDLVPHSAEYLRFLPEIVLTFFGILIMLLEAASSRRDKVVLGYIALLGIALAFAANVLAYSNRGQAFQNMILVDGYGTFFRGLVLVVGFLCVLASFSYLARENAQGGEYYALIVFSLVGQCILATSSDLIMVFIGLEISSIATYILAGYLRDDRRNNEAALKYFLLGSFATAFLLYGIAWIYGLTASTNLDKIETYLSGHAQSPSVLAGLAAGLIFVGLAFKVSVAPFQVWTPDVYQGAAAPVSAFMSAGPKAAAFAVFFRIFVTSFGPLHERWVPIVWACALLTMIVGNFAALVQTNVKRLLGYSSIAHAGYVLVALTSDSQIGIAAGMFYLASYALMNIGAFAIVSHVASRREQHVHIDDLAGLARREPATAALLAVFVFSLIGVPLTGGFFGKFYVFQAALDSHLVWLTVLGLVNSAIAAYYYLKILVAAYMKEPGEATLELLPPSPTLRLAIWASALGTLALGIFPSALLSFASLSASASIRSAVAPACGNLAPMSTSASTAPDQLRAAMTRTNDLFNTEVFGKQNFDALDQIYTANARILPPGAPMISGRKAIKEFWSNLVQSANAKSAVLTSVDVMPTSDGAVEIGRATLTVQPQGQAASEMEVKYVVYWKQEEGLWKWHVDIWNQNS